MLTIEQVIAKFPAALQPWATRYAPLLTGWTLAGIDAFVALLRAGDLRAAEEALCAQMNAQALLLEGQGLLADWRKANDIDAAWRDVAAQAFRSFLGILLTLGLAAVGL